MSTKIVTTIGPSSFEKEVLEYFVNHSVQIARLNFSHGTSEWHNQAGDLCKSLGMELMLDLAGPKILLGGLNQEVEVTAGQEVVVEYIDPEKDYPGQDSFEGKQMLLLPCQFEITKFVKEGKSILVDDGKMIWRVKKVLSDKIICSIEFGGVIKSNKGMNLPETSIDLDFLVKRDRELLKDTVAYLKPCYVAPSFVKTVEDLNLLKKYIQEILDENGIEGYFPKICTKLETFEVMEDSNLEAVIEASDMIMIARGDLALETLPSHVMTPFYQKQIGDICKEKGKPFIVATEMLNNMTSSPVPTRAEVSDIYRAVVVEKANFIMLSGETAAGKFPKEAVGMMDSVIKKAEELGA